jgi:hypothetical protein
MKDAGKGEAAATRMAEGGKGRGPRGNPGPLGRFGGEVRGEEGWLAPRQLPPILKARTKPAS